jgi:hypothetical protein
VRENPIYVYWALSAATADMGGIDGSFGIDRMVTRWQALSTLMRETSIHRVYAAS